MIGLVHTSGTPFSISGLWSRPYCNLDPSYRSTLTNLNIANLTISKETIQVVLHIPCLHLWFTLWFTHLCVCVAKVLKSAVVHLTLTTTLAVVSAINHNSYSRWFSTYGYILHSIHVIAYLFGFLYYCLLIIIIIYSNGLVNLLGQLSCTGARRVCVCVCATR